MRLRDKVWLSTANLKLACPSNWAENTLGHFQLNGLTHFKGELPPFSIDSIYSAVIKEVTKVTNENKAGGSG